MLIQRAVDFLRDIYDRGFVRALIISGAATLVLTLLSLLGDAFLPEGPLVNIPRSILMAALSVTLFSFLYFLSYRLHLYLKSREDNVWVPIRLRFSPTWRRGISLVALSPIIVLMAAVSSNSGIGESFGSALILCGIYALLFFIRKTPTERSTEELGLEDARDVKVDIIRKEFDEENER